MDAKTATQRWHKGCWLDEQVYRLTLNQGEYLSLWWYIREQHNLPSHQEDTDEQLLELAKTQLSKWRNKQIEAMK